MHGIEDPSKSGSLFQHHKKAVRYKENHLKTKSQHKKTTTTQRFKGIEWLFMNLPFVCYLALLIGVYIYSAHSVEGKLRKIEALKAEVNDTKWRYMDVKKDIMYGSTQSQIESKVAELDLKPIRNAPIKISDSN